MPKYYKIENNHLVKCNKPSEFDCIMLERIEYNALLDINIQELQKKNENMLRIIRERSNQERGIKNKKQHSGYIVKKSTSFDYWLNGEKIVLWKSIIQTPYPIQFSFDDIKKMIINDKNKYITKLGLYAFVTDSATITVGNGWDINSIHDEEDEHAYLKGRLKHIREHEPENFKTKNFIYDVQYQQNTHRPHLWDIILTHPFPLTIPKEMML